MKVFNIAGIEIFSSIYEYLDSNMYVLLTCDEEAVIIDPHIDEACLSLLKKKNIKRINIILTHEHTDHTSGIFWYQERFDCQIICQKECAVFISDKRRMRPLLIMFTLEEHDRMDGTNRLEQFKKDYVIRTYQANIEYDKSYDYTIGGYNFHFEHIPGHSKGSSLIVLNNKIAFTGDSLMKANPVITRFPGSNHQLYVEYTLPILSSLSNEIEVLPGHGEPFSIKDMMVDGNLNIDYM